MENEQSGSSQNYVNILVISPDLTLAKAVQTACQTIAAENPDKSYRVFPGVNAEKVAEAIDKYVFHSVLVEEEHIKDTLPENYVNMLREIMKKKPENAAAPLVLVSSESNENHSRRMVRAGWRDVLLKPLDRTFFLQKMSLYNDQIAFLKEALLFSMDLKDVADLSFSFETASISEYGMKISSNREIEKGTVVGLSSAFLEEKFAAVVLDCSKSGESFGVQLMFIGVTPAQTQAIRKFIRIHYADEKQAG